MKYKLHERVVLVNPHAYEGEPLVMIARVNEIRHLDKAGEVTTVFATNEDTMAVYQSTPNFGSVNHTTYFMKALENVEAPGNLEAYYDAEQLLTKLRRRQEELENQIRMKEGQEFDRCLKEVRSLRDDIVVITDLIKSELGEKIDISFKYDAWNGLHPVTYVYQISFR